MSFIDAITRPFQRRNMAVSSAVVLRAGQPNWTQWTTVKATKEGLKASAWLYRAAKIITDNAASVPWGVKNSDGEWMPDHHIDKMLKNPNPEFSRLDVFQLITLWPILTGTAYLQKNRINGQTRELWPLAPDRLGPIVSKERGKLIAGYAARDENGKLGTKVDPDYPVEDIIHFRWLDPSNPVKGISPMEPCARAIDIDAEQQNWNKAAMQNRGVVDLLISFKDVIDREQLDTAKENIEERITSTENARKPLVLGADAKATRMGLTPAEMDWSASRKDNRDEIFTALGVPLQFASQDFSTYNNFATAMRVLWMNTIIPLLADQADTLTTAFRDELPEGARCAPDLSDVEALREDQETQSKTVRQYWDMGVPLSVLNQKHDLGLEEFDGWDLPWSGKPSAAGRTLGESGEAKRQATEPKESRVRLIEKRDVEAEQKRRDELAEGPMFRMYAGLLEEQRKAVLKALEAGGSADDVEKAIRANADDWKAGMETAAAETAFAFADTVVEDKRGRLLFAIEHREGPEDEFAARFAEKLKAYLEREEWLLRELSMLTETTVDKVIEQVSDGLAQGRSVGEIAEAISDIGVFNDERALMLARTLTGTAASIGQMSAAEASGATIKRWETSGFEVRDEHNARHGEEVGIDGVFSDQGYGSPRYPLDPNMPPAERVNCRCSMSFGT